MKPPRDLPPLPVDAAVPHVLEHLERHPNLVLLAPPGSGKTTRVPPALTGSGLLGEGSCIVLEPRRIAARAAARRVAAEQGAGLGDAVGYQVRFDRKGCGKTRLWYVTEGILTARLQSDPTLEGVAAVVLDEFHERSLETDLALALLREIQQQLRPELRLLVMSATLDPGPVSAYLNAPVVESGGRPHPVEIRYRERAEDSPLPARAAAAVREVWSLRPGNEGDVLVFLPGTADIRRTGEALAHWAEDRGVAVLPLHGSLTPERQDRALRRGERPRVVLATNVAESSVTVAGVNTVVDSGFAKVAHSDPGSGVDRLEVERISRASADQRAGRAGRNGPGLALRLWTRHDEQGMRPRQTPEIRRLDLAPTALQVLGWGHPDPTTFPWFDPPQAERLNGAVELLQLLGAVDPAGRLTPDGEQLRRLPLHPRQGRLLLHATEHGLAREGALLATLLSEADILTSGAGHQPQSGIASDLLLRLERLEQAVAARLHGPSLQRLGLAPGAVRTVVRAAKQVERLVADRRGEPRPGGPAEAEQILLRATLAAYPDRVARRRDPSHYQLTGGRGARLGTHCAVRDAGFLVAPRLRGARRGAFSRDHIEWASRIEPEWLGEIQPLQRNRTTTLDLDRQCVTCQETVSYQDLAVTEREVPPEPEQAADLLLAYAAEDPPTRLAPSPAVLSLVARCRFLRRRLPELELPGWDRSDWERALLPAALAAAPSLKRLRKTDLLPHLRSLLSWKQRTALDREAPERIRVASGNQLRIDYVRQEEDERPVLAVKIQELFGCRAGPRIAAGRAPLLLHLLGPHGRPLQITDDLESFWAHGYPEVRKEMRGRYPKHRWPEDPVAAEPSRSSISRRPR